MDRSEIAPFSEIFTGELTAIGNWVVASVHSSVAWPLSVEMIDFRRHRIFLGPRSTTAMADGSAFTRYPFAAVNLPVATASKEGRQLISHFLSTISWVESGGITVEHWSGGSRFNPMGENRSGGLVTNNFELDYLPDPNDQRARWALAFYREGLSLERFNIAYATLSYFKILNIIASKGSLQASWIKNNISDFGMNSYLKSQIDIRCAELKKAGVPDIGKYLYESCRCAVAHAGTSPTIDPENSDDMERLSKDLVVIRAMAAHVIEKELHIKSRYTIFREHLYELEGFKDIFGSGTIAKIIQGDTTHMLAPVDIPTINVQIRGKRPYDPLSNMLPIEARFENGTINLVLQSFDNRGQIKFKLDFSQERLHFDLLEDLIYKDDGTSEAADAISEIKRFSSDYFGNGRLHIYNTDTDALISRKDAYIPMNIILDFVASEYEIAYWKQLAHQRRLRTASVVDEILQWSDPYFLSVAVSFNGNKA